MSNKPQKENDPRGKRESFYTPKIQDGGGMAQDYEPPVITPEVAIDTFGEVAREPVCENLQRYCREWQAKKNAIAELERIIPTLPVIDDGVSLRKWYELSLPQLKQELWRIEWHIRRLQRCLELLEQRELFPRPALRGHVDVESLKERIDIAEVISRWVELRRAGKNLSGRCPFHDDRSPSLVVYPESRRWWCFGTCNAGGDVITFVQKILNCGFREAVAELQKS